MPTQHLKYQQSNPVRYEIEMQILLLRSASGCLIGWTMLSLSAISVLLHFSSVGIFALITQSIHNLASLQEILKYFQPPKTQSWSDQQITVVHYWDTLLLAPQLLPQSAIFIPSRHFLTIMAVQCLLISNEGWQGPGNAFLPWHCCSHSHHIDPNLLGILWLTWLVNNKAVSHKKSAWCCSMLSRIKFLIFLSNLCLRSLKCLSTSFSLCCGDRARH